jgi:hypothetical protein
MKLTGCPKGGRVKKLPVMLVIALSAISAFGQDAKAKVDPPVVEAGKNITITLTLDRAPSTNLVNVNVTLAPKETPDNPPQFDIGTSAKAAGSNVYISTITVPLNARGAWYVKNAYSQVNGASTPIALADHPEFKVKPVEVVLPKSGDVAITVP